LANASEPASDASETAASVPWDDRLLASSEQSDSSLPSEPTKQQSAGAADGAIAGVAAWSAEHVRQLAMIFGADADLADLERAVQNLIDHLEETGERVGDLLADPRTLLVAAMLAGAVAAEASRRRARRRADNDSIEDESWIWLFSDLLGEAPRASHEA
jgi:hypothetical protein